MDEALGWLAVAGVVICGFVAVLVESPIALIAAALFFALVTWLGASRST